MGSIHAMLYSSNIELKGLAVLPVAEVWRYEDYKICTTIIGEQVEVPLATAALYSASDDKPQKHQSHGCISLILFSL